MTNVETKIIQMTPEMCKYWLGRNPRNRPIDRRLVDQYSRDIIAGSWQLNGETICIDENGNLINGQHRCHAGIKANRSFETILVTGLKSSAMDTIDGGKKRTYSDRLRMRDVKNASAVAATISFMAQIAARNLKRPALSPKEMDRVLEVHPGIEESAAVALRSNRTISAWLAAVHYIGTYLGNKDDADAFARTLLDGQKNYEHDAAVFYRDFLFKDVIKHNPSHIDFRRKLFVHAWNKFVEREPMKQARIPDVFFIPGWYDLELGI